MKQILFRLLALVLVLCLFVQGANAGAPAANSASFTPFSEIVYVRPDMDSLQALLDTACELCHGNDANALLKAVFDFYDGYDWVYTCSSLANIHYSADLTDSYWAEENDCCLRMMTQADQMMDTLYLSLTQSPCRNQLEKKYFGFGFFSSYDEKTPPSAHMLALLDRENELVSQYYSQSADSDSFLHVLFPSSRATAQTLVELIQVRNEIAQDAGYDCYEDYANEQFYYRDYSSEEMAAYLEEIQEKLVPLYRDVLLQSDEYTETTEAETLDYLRVTVENMGGDLLDCFHILEDGQLYDISYGKNKYATSFETYLYSYFEPFLFLSPQQNTYDHLLLAHEFGHFCNDHLSHGTVAGIDVSEIFSQGLEYLSLCYHPDTEELTRLKMIDSLCTFVEQACYARFEQEMYRIPSDALNVDVLCELYDRIARDYGFDAVGYDKMEFTEINHFYTNPMYVSSYIISNDAAMQLYQMELEAPGSGLACFESNITTTESYFLAFLENAGLDSPFVPGRIDQVTQTYLNIFGE